MPDSGPMPEPDNDVSAELLQLALPISQKVVLVIDLVESVRLMAADESGTVSRWHSFVRHAQDHTVAAHQGRLVKSLGDGLMVEFERPRDAVNAAHDLHSSINKGNAGLPPAQQMHLRAGINNSHVYTDNMDIYGAGVNLAARLATLAGPGETVASASVRDGLTDGLDAKIEDLGECYLKHIEQPVRGYRVSPTGATPLIIRREPAVRLQPIVAVIPFTARSNEPEHFAIGELIAEGVIGQLSRTVELKVISRLSTTVFRDRDSGLQELHAHLGANFVLAGSYVANAGKLLVMAELSDINTHEIVWSSRIHGDTSDLLQTESETVHKIASGIFDSLLSNAAQLARANPWRTLSGYSLMLAGITLTHRTTRRDFTRARDIFSHLTERHPRNPAVPAWLAKWHVLEAAQGWSADMGATTRLALTQSTRALDLDPDSSLALAIDGFVRADLLKDFDGAMGRYDAAIQINPSESVAWLFKGLLHGFRGEKAEAIEAVDRALLLSPLDPAKYFFDSLAASAYLSAGSYARATELAKSSLRANATHVSTYRALVIAQGIGGDTEGARNSAQRLVQLDPGFTVTKFLARRSGGGFDEMSRSFAEALRQAGIPN